MANLLVVSLATPACLAMPASTMHQAIHTSMAVQISITKMPHARSNVALIQVSQVDAKQICDCNLPHTALSPWTALEYCSNVPGVNDTWVCHAPESCGCDWPFSANMVPLAPRGCREMGSEARVALFAPTVIAPYISLPSSQGGSTGYYSTTTAPGLSTTWVSTAIAGCKKSSQNPQC